MGNEVLVHFQTDHAVAKGGFKMEYNQKSKLFEHWSIYNVRVIENCTAKSFIFVGEGCDNFLLIGNGICNGENNNQKCLYDGGDCCGYDCPDCQCFHEKICAIGG